MSLPSPPRATSAPSPPSMMSLALATPEGVVVSATPDAVSDRASGAGVALALIDGLGVDARRHGRVGHPVPDSSVGHPQQLLVLVAFRGPVVLHGARTGDELAGAAHGCRGPGDVLQVELAVRCGERIGLEVLGVGVAHDQLGERVALKLGTQVHARGAGQVVEPVAVLEVGQLLLEHVVERAAEQASEEVGALGQAADPQVDVIDTGDGLATDIRPVGCWVADSEQDAVRACRPRALRATAAVLSGSAQPRGLALRRESQIRGRGRPSRRPGPSRPELRRRPGCCRRSRRSWCRT